MDELKACPFCGSEGEIKQSYFLKNGWFAVGCTKDDCIANNAEQDEQGGFSAEYKTNQEAIDAWNNRPAEAALTTESERCKENYKYARALDIEHCRILNKSIRGPK
jgi:hypothetical protein